MAVSIAKSGTDGFEYHVVELIRARSPFTRVFIKELEEAGVSYHRGFVPPVRFHYIFERLAAVLFPLWFLPLFLKYRPAVVHSHTEMPDLAVSLFFRVFPHFLKHCRVVRTIHNTQLWAGMKRTGRYVERFFIRNRSNVAISETVCANYAKEYGSGAPVIHNGVSAEEQRPYNGILPDCVNILFAGRFEPQKGITVLVEIIKRMRGDGRYHFHLIGDGSMRPLVERELGGLHNVTLRPPLHGLSSYLSSFSCLLMPSEFEGLSILALEAGMNGLPVICNDCPGLRETVPEGWPLQVHGNSMDSYVSIFRDLLPQTDIARLGSEARAFVSERFGVRRMQEKYERFYETEFSL